MGGVVAEERKAHGQKCSAVFTLPPLSIMAFQPEPETQVASP
jgi:hypothetical protein